MRTKLLSVLLPFGIVVALAACAPGGGTNPLTCDLADAPNSDDDPQELTVPVAHDDCLQDQDDTDFFTVHVPEGTGTITITCNGSDAVVFDGPGNDDGACTGTPVIIDDNNPNDADIELVFSTNAESLTDDTYGFTVTFVEDL
jgi:hypothetical protein